MPFTFRRMHLMTLLCSARVGIAFFPRLPQLLCDFAVKRRLSERLALDMAVLPSIVPGILTLILLCSAPKYVHLSDTGSFSLPKGVNGGIGCVACTAVVALMEQLSVVHNVTFVEAYVKFCNVLPNLYRNACIALGKFYIPQVINLIEAEFTADIICHAIHLCYQEKGQPFCHAFPPKNDIRKSVSQAKEEVASKLFYESARLHRPKDTAFDPCTLEGVKELCKLFNRVFTNDLPLIDLDNDTYSASVESWRGTSWRGRDCDDINHLSHPGAKPRDWDTVFDSNCNGIYGKDPIFGKPYEELFCKGWPSFHIYFNASLQYPPSLLIASSLRHLKPSPTPGKGFCCNGSVWGWVNSKTMLSFRFYKEYIFHGLIEFTDCPNVYLPHQRDVPRPPPHGTPLEILIMLETLLLHVNVLVNPFCGGGGGEGIDIF